MKINKPLLFAGASTFIGLSVLKNTFDKAHQLPNHSLKEKSLQMDSPLASINWISEDDYRTQMEEIVIPYLEKYQETGIFNHDSQSLHYHHFVPDTVKATILLIHGFNEYKEKYSEFIYYLLQAQMEVFILDLRGHGKSKQSDQQTRIHVDDFEDYLRDIDAFVNKIVLLQGHSHHLTLFGHSMGGAIATAYLQEYKNPFDKVILHAPMLSINLGQQDPLTLSIFLTMMRLCHLDFMHIPTLEKYNPEESPKFNSDSKVVKNTERAKYYHDLNFILHAKPTKGGSMSWLNTSMKITQRITRPQAIRQLTQEILTIRAGNDHIVNKEGIFAIQQYGRKVTSVVVPNAYHEIFSESDSVIQAYYSMILDFLDTH